MLWEALFISSVVSIPVIVSGHCIDINSKVVTQGLYYFPGPNPCTFCQCDKGIPKWCKSVLCSPPNDFTNLQNCKSFQLGNNCCDYKCLDEILTANENYKETYDLALRLIASAVTAVLSLSLLFFLLHRLRRRKLQIHQNRHLNEDQRSLNSIGYIAGGLSYNIGYLGGGPNAELDYHYEDAGTHISLWKPHGNYFPRDEAPPPYEEAVRAAQAETEAIRLSQVQEQVVAQITHAQVINTQQQQSERGQEHEYANVAAIYQNCLRNEGASGRGRYEKSNSYENVVLRDESVCSTKLTCINERVKKKNDKQSKPVLKESNNKKEKSFYENVKHRTVPNLSEYQLKDGHKMKEATRKDLQKKRVGERSESNLKGLLQPKLVQIHRTLPSTLKDLSCCNDVKKSEDNSTHRSLPKQILKKYETPLTLNLVKSQINLLESSLQTITHKTSDAIASSASFRLSPKAKVKEDESSISYQYQSSSQDEDDYRSECENCKSAGLDDDEVNETMTLQRRPLDQTEEVSYYRTSVTLPSDTRKPRAVNINPGREGWFVTMRETSSSEESE